jgi:lipoprotein-releasing system ATP-binding protein
MLKATGIKKAYRSIEVLKGVDLEIDRGELIAIVGASGAGKSTLLHILGSLDIPDSGSVFINGQEMLSQSSDSLAEFRNKHLGFVFQFHNLLPEFSALENVMIPGLIAKRKETEVRTESLKLLDLLGIAARESHKPSELSGGEQQRVAVARALINSPLVIFADEPSGNLDSKNAADLHQLFFKLRDELNQTFVIVTHNPEFAEMANRRLEIKDGVIVN